MVSVDKIIVDITYHIHQKLLTTHFIMTGYITHSNYEFASALENDLYDYLLE